MTQIQSGILHTCIYKKHKNGMGGVAIDKDSGCKISILETAENFALDNDEVIVVEDAENSGEKYGLVQKVIKHNTHNLSGTIQAYKEQFLLRVANPKFGNYLVFIKSHLQKIDREALFNCVIKTYPSPTQPYFEVELVNTIGKVGEDQAYVSQLIIEAGLPIDFSKAAIAEADALPEKVDYNHLSGRVDLRHLPFVTIDGADAKDFDDAIYCELEQGKYKLFVAIADVAHYVTSGSALDKEAYLRSTSVYFPKQVIPMLPEKISNGLCSLNPHVDRFVMCCEMIIELDGTITEYKVFDGIIHSAARLTYTRVQEWIDENSLIPPELINNISNLYLVFQALLHSREQRGAIDFDTIEPMFLFDEQGLVQELQPRVRLESHKLIEECMLAANVCVADFIIKNHQAALFRVHGKPTIEKFAALKQFLNSIAVAFEVKYEELTPVHYANLLKQVHDHTQFPAIQQAVLRSMQLALYSPTNIGHFGLSYSRYVHFTSPIRRYPDLLIHRVAKSIIANKEYEYSQDLVAIGNQTSFAERRAEDLERKINAFYKCQYAKTHIGKEYNGIITTIVNFGAFVYIPELMLDGLVHVTELGSDYFTFDEKKQILTGKKTGVKFHAGQELRIEIAGVDMAKLFIDFKLVVK